MPALGRVVAAKARLKYHWIAQAKPWQAIAKVGPGVWSRVGVNRPVASGPRGGEVAHWPRRPRTFERKERAMFEQLTKATEVVLELQNWLEDRDDLSQCPVAGVSWTSENELEVSIGRLGVWSSLVDEEDNLTLDYCKGAFLEEVAALEPFMEEAKKSEASREVPY